VPFSGHRSSLSHPDVFRTVQSLGRLARRVYDAYRSNQPAPPTRLALMPAGRSARRAQVRSSGPNGYNPTNTTDLAVVPPKQSNVPRRVPRNIASLLAWDSVKVESVIAVPTTGVTETNFVFSLSQHPQASSWEALFDQFCIPMATVVFESQLPPGATFAPAQLVTGLDFDNNTNISSVANLEDYSTSESRTMSCGSRVMRSIRCIPKNVVSNSGSSSFTGVLGPQWLDCAGTGPNIPHFCVRSILESSSTTYNIKVTQTIWFAFRNQI
jgi:hypothetical protein